ncbi:MAG: orotate phosphoribosyltransferase [Candidatus Marinimicrobia bacterium]|nr:orotate phosphoribosyltransferase [Candidatus Neomarinimicrobiota bacterium]MCF7830007.1 orotate phosphoribosyltransferase [Candidatus Neomarinimicrobiota bacterium]MCF7881951.1 orotate phosphoribosyltransferase [Candidatus Neomarinimicrobiota bacterium]
MNKQFDIEQLLKDSGAYLEGHFLLSSGMHSPHYYEKFRLLENPKYNALVADAIAQKFNDNQVDVVASAAVGGILLAYEVARCFNVRTVFAERVEENLTFRRGFDIRSDENVLLVEDIVTTGGSVLELRDVVKETGATVQGIGIIVDRSNGRFDPGVKWSALYTAAVENYQVDECPLCEQGIPMTTRGRTGKSKQGTE